MQVSQDRWVKMSAFFSVPLCSALTNGRRDQECRHCCCNKVISREKVSDSAESLAFYGAVCAYSFEGTARSAIIKRMSPNHCSLAAVRDR